MTPPRFSTPYHCASTDGVADTHTAQPTPWVTALMMSTAALPPETHQIASAAVRQANAARHSHIGSMRLPSAPYTRRATTLVAPEIPINPAASPGATPASTA